LFPIPQHGEGQSAALWRLEGKHTQLLEKHNKLLEIVIRVTNANELYDLHQGIAQILEKEIVKNMLNGVTSEFGI
jgi:hypothetical protein